MNESITSVIDDVLIVGVQGFDDSYFLWQKGLTKNTGSEDGIHFEYDDQSNGGYNIVKECTVTNDGIHIVLTNEKLAHFYFPNGFNKFEELNKGLKEIYSDNENILDFII